MNKVNDVERLRETERLLIIIHRTEKPVAAQSHAAAYRAGCLALLYDMKSSTDRVTLICRLAGGEGP